MESARMVPGFRFGATSAGIKPGGKLDLALLLADEEVPAAAVFTRNRVQAAPVLLSRQRILEGRARGVLVNSGNANACTGEGGLEAAESATRAVADAARIDERGLLVASTGIIGVPLPLEKIIAAREALLATTRPDGFQDFASAILTTDRGPKVAARSVSLGRRTVHLVGCCKGAGMIAPNMATTLGFVVTDAVCKKRGLRATLRAAADASFNQVSVDGDTSTNDSLFVFASGRAGNRPLAGEAGDGGAAAGAFQEALIDLLRDLASQILRDGEGATHVVTIEVDGAPSNRDAEAVARRIGASPLVKTAIFGSHPNWGRILAAVGNAGVDVDVSRVAIRIGEVLVAHHGVGVDGVAEAARAAMQQERYTIHVHLHRGRGTGRHVTCDLTTGYVQLNAEYPT